MTNSPLCIPPMGIGKIPKGKESILPTLCGNGQYFGQLKKDGFWYEFEKSCGEGFLFSRTISAVTNIRTEKSANVPHIMEVLNNLPDGTIIIGEIYYPNKRSKDVTSIMGCLPQKAIQRQDEEYGPLHYYIHDMIYYNGTNLMNYGAEIRYDLLKKVYEKYFFGKYTIDDKIFIELAEKVTENIEDAIVAALAAGEEGMVLKKKTAPYSPGERPAWDTIKIKKTDTCDAICIGWCDPTCFYDGKLNIGVNYSSYDGNYIENVNAIWPYWAIFKKKDQLFIEERKVPIGEQIVIKEMNFGTYPVTKAYYYGWKTAMRIGAYDENHNIVEIGTISSGLTEALEEDAAKYPAKYLDKVVELAGMEKDPVAHTLRHFHFERFRDDKNSEDCTLKEIF